MSDLTINGVVPGGGACPVPVGDRMCRATAGTDMLMCRSHWRAVPHPIQSRVYRARAAYDAGAITLEALRLVQTEAVEEATR